jgi:hypothetical protein
VISGANGEGGESLEEGRSRGGMCQQVTRKSERDYTDALPSYQRTRMDVDNLCGLRWCAGMKGIGID